MALQRISFLCGDRPRPLASLVLAGALTACSSANPLDGDLLDDDDDNATTSAATLTASSTSPTSTSTPPTTSVSTTDSSGDSTLTESTADSSSTAPTGTDTANATDTEATTGSTTDTSSTGVTDSSTTTNTDPCEVDEDLGSALGADVSTLSSNAKVGDDILPSCVFGGTDSQDAVFSWTAPADATYGLRLSNATYDTVMAIYDPTCSTEQACNDDISFPSASNSALGLIANEGDQFIIVVDGFDGNTGTFQLDIIQNAAFGGTCCGADSCDSTSIQTCTCEASSSCCEDMWSESCRNLAMALCDADCS